MPKGSFLQTSFLGGAWSLTSQARADLPHRRNAMAVCQNSIPTEEGVVVRRPGSQYAGSSRMNVPSVVRSIDFTGAAPLTMEMTAGHIRFRLGVGLCHTSPSNSSPFGIISISTATPAIVTINDYPTKEFETGYPVLILPVGAVSVQALAYLNQRVISLTKQTTTTFAMYDEATGAAINGNYVGWTAGCQANMVQVVDLVTPYAQADLSDIRLIQNEYQIMLLHPNYAPNFITILPNLGGLVPALFVPTHSNMSFSFSAVVFIDGPYLDPSGSREATAYGLSGSVIVKFSTITDINNGIGFLQTDVGRQIRMFSEPPYYDPTVTYVTSQAVTYNNSYYVFTGLQISTVAGTQPVIDTTGPVTGTPDALPVTWKISEQVQSWTWGVINYVADSHKITVTFEGPQTYWGIIPMTYALGVYSNTTGWPACGCYHEGRYWLAGAQSNRFDGSVANNIFQISSVGATYFQPATLGGDPNTSEFVGINTYVNQLSFAPTDAGGTYLMPGLVLDSNAISETLNSGENNQIVWMQPNAQGILMGTPSGEYLIQASNQNNVLTPTSIQAHQVTKYGCANAEPRRAGLTTLFVQKYGRKLFELLADVFSGKFVGPNLAEQTKLITLPGIQEIAYQEETAPICWMLMQGGGLVGTTYRRVSLFSTEPPKFNAWHTHSLGTGYTINSVTCGPAPTATVENPLPVPTQTSFQSADCLTISTTSPNGAQSNVELIYNIDEQYPLPTSWYLDCGISPPAIATSLTGFPAGGMTLLGLHDIAGAQVTVFIAGLNCGQYTVPSNRQLFIPYGSDPDGLFTAAYVAQITAALSTYVGAPERSYSPVDNGASYLPCVVGIPFVSQGQLLQQLDPAPGANGPLLGKTRRTHMFSVLLANCVTNTIQFGTNLGATLMPALFQSPGGTPYNASQPYNGTYWNTLNADYNFYNGIAWQITGPFPATICAVEGFFEVADR